MTKKKEKELCKKLVQQAAKAVKLGPKIITASLVAIDYNESGGFHSASLKISAEVSTEMGKFKIDEEVKFPVNYLNHANLSKSIVDANTPKPKEKPKVDKKEPAKVGAGFTPPKQ